jgi:hypothetical protein
MKTIEDVLSRLRAEYLEMPGLRLKADQVRRLCGVEPTMCQMVLDSLVNAKFLYAKPDGHYARLTDGAHVPRPQPARAVPKTEPRGVRVAWPIVCQHRALLPSPERCLAAEEIVESCERVKPTTRVRARDPYVDPDGW